MWRHKIGLLAENFGDVRLCVCVRAGKFKSSEDSFKADLLPISPQELLALLKESECQEAIKGMKNSGISDDDLKKLLDRSDLTAKWMNQLHGNPGYYYVNLLAMNMPHRIV